MNQKSVNMVYLGVFLCLVCAVAAGVMGSVAVMTKEPIAKAKVQKISDGLRAVLPPFNNNPMEDVRTYREDDGSEAEFYRAFQDGKLVGVVAKVATAIGYGGRMDGLVSFTPDGKIRTVIVTGHNETPGLGKKAEEDWYMAMFQGKGGTEPIPTAKSMLPADLNAQVSGATITFTGVSSALAAGSEYVKGLGGSI